MLRRVSWGVLRFVAEHVGHMSMSAGVRSWWRVGRGKNGIEGREANGEHGTEAVRSGVDDAPSHRVEAFESVRVESSELELAPLDGQP